MKISIIIPVWNKEKYTKSCLNDLIKLKPTRLIKNYEIIIVDNASTDKTESIVNDAISSTAVGEVMEESPISIKYIKQNRNYGFANACNRGYRESSGEIIMFLNNDIKVLDNFESWAANLAGSLFIFDGKDRLVGPTGAMVDHKTFEFKYETNGDKPYNYISAWCIIGMRYIWNQLDTGDGQPFSEEFGIAFFEDTDLGFRATEKNILMKLSPIPVKHYGHVTAKQLNVNYLYRNAKKIFTKKWGDKR